MCTVIAYVNVFSVAYMYKCIAKEICAGILLFYYWGTKLQVILSFQIWVLTTSSSLNNVYIDSQFKLYKMNNGKCRVNHDATTAC